MPEKGKSGISLVKARCETDYVGGVGALKLEIGKIRWLLS